LLLEVQTASLAAVKEALCREMEGVASLRVPLRVELKLGPNWGELRPVARMGIGPVQADRSEAVD